MLQRLSPCKVNLLLNILSKRPDGFHELETVMQPVALHDELQFSIASTPGIQLTCNHPELPVDRANLVYRAAESFLQAAGIRDGVRIHLAKRLPLAAGLGGGSANAAVTLLALNDLFDAGLPHDQLHALAAHLGSDVPFFLKERPALATGRGEHVESLAPFPALAGRVLLLIHPGFGISTAWAYQTLAHFPHALNGRPGRARELISALQDPGFSAGRSMLYNSLEAPALHKYPILGLYQEHLREHGADAALMSGSGSTTFAIAANRARAEALAEAFRRKFGDAAWMQIADLPEQLRG